MDAFRNRIENFIYDAWKVFAHKAGNEEILINNAASMQLNFAFLLKQHIDFIIYDKKEKVEIELEHTQLLKKSNKPIDILLKTSNGKGTLHIPIKLKCYRPIARAGGNSSAYDLFKKEVFTDLALLEQYASLPHFVQGYALIMTDVKSLVYPLKHQSAQQGDYTLSQVHEIEEGTHLKSSMGGQEVDITLRKSYRFEWHQHGSFWFSLIQGI